VTDDFKMLVPINGNNSVELKALKLPQPAKRAAICALTGRAGIKHSEREAVADARRPAT